MVNYFAGSPATLPMPRRQISNYPPASSFRTTLTLTPLCCLFLIASSLSPHLARFIARSVGHFCFRLRGSMGLTIGLAIKWPAALLFNAAEPSCWRSSYRRSSHQSSSHCRSGPLESEYLKWSYHRSTHRGSTHRGLSHRRCDVNKRQGYFGGRKMMDWWLVKNLLT